MAKIVIFLLLASFIQISLMLFAGTGTDVAFPDVGGGTTTITDLIVNPETWYGNLFYVFLNASLAGFLVAGTIIVGAYFFRNEWVFYAGIAFLFLTMLAPIINLWQVLSAQGIFGEASLFVLSLFIAPLFILGLGMILDFSRGKD